MKYYSETKEVIDIPSNAYSIGKGSFGTIYPYKSKDCIKIFKEYLIPIFHDEIFHHFITRNESL